MDIKSAASQLLGGTGQWEDGIETERIALAEQRLQLSLPEPLKTLYSLVGNQWILMESFEQILPPEELQLKDGKLFFAEESQGVCTWAVDCFNLSVYQENSGELHPENMELEAFLILLLYYNCAQGGFEYSAMAAVESVEEILSQLSDQWRLAVDHNGLILYAKGDNLVWWLADSSRKPIEDCVYLSARTEASFNQYCEELGMNPL